MVNPKLVMPSISGFGQDGQKSERPAYAPVIIVEWITGQWSR